MSRIPSPFAVPITSPGFSLWQQPAVYAPAASGPQRFSARDAEAVVRAHLRKNSTNPLFSHLTDRIKATEDRGAYFSIVVAHRLADVSTEFVVDKSRREVTGSFLLAPSGWRARRQPELVP